MNQKKTTTYVCIHFTIVIDAVMNRFGGVKVSVLAPSAVDHGFKPRSGQTKDSKIYICCFSAKHKALGSKNKDGLAQSQDNVSE